MSSNSFYGECTKRDKKKWKPCLRKRTKAWQPDPPWEWLLLWWTIYWRRCELATFRLHVHPGVKEQNYEDLHSKFITHSNDVFVVAYPKSGTTWTQQIVKLERNNGIKWSLGWIWWHSKRRRWRNVSTFHNWNYIQSILLCACTTPFISIEFAQSFQDSLSCWDQNRRGIDQSPAKYIYVYHNPKDTAVSFFHLPKVIFHTSLGICSFSDSQQERCFMTSWPYSWMVCTKG